MANTEAVDVLYGADTGLLLPGPYGTIIQWTKHVTFDKSI